MIIWTPRCQTNTSISLRKWQTTYAKERIYIDLKFRIYIHLLKSFRPRQSLTNILVTRLKVIIQLSDVLTVSKYMSCFVTKFCRYWFSIELSYLLAAPRFVSISRDWKKNRTRFGPRYDLIEQKKLAALQEPVIHHSATPA